MSSAAATKKSNFMNQFRDSQTKELKNLTSAQFIEVWSHYDKDGNGYIEDRELDSFLREFISSVSPTDTTPESVTEASLAEIRQCFMDAYDDNKDGKIEIRELAQLLPLEESFLLLFRFDNPLDSSIDFMKIWKKYDTDNSGSIDSDELKNFLRDLLSKQRPGGHVRKEELTEGKLQEYTDNLLSIFDANKDGKLQLNEMARLLPVKQNFLSSTTLKGMDGSKLTKEDIERVFNEYDKDNNGSIEGDELTGFLKDLLEAMKKDYDATDLESFREVVLSGCDTNNDGKVDKKELTMILMALNKDRTSSSSA